MEITILLCLFVAMLVAPLGIFAALPVEATAKTTVSNVEDLRILLRKSQKEWMAISPPSTEIVYWDSRNDEDIFVDWFSGGWPESATKLAVAILDQNLIPRIEIRLWESPETGIITVANRYGETMATLKPEQGFDSLGWALEFFAPSELTAFQKIIHASWHSALSLTLTPYSFAEVCAEISTLLSKFHHVCTAFMLLPWREEGRAP